MTMCAHNGLLQYKVSGYIFDLQA